MLSERDLELADEIFESTAKHLLDKKASLFNKYRYLLFKESMVSNSTEIDVDKYLKIIYNLICSKLLAGSTNI